MQDLITVKIVKGRGWWSILSNLIWVISHLCFVLYSFPIDCIDAKCLTQCQSQLGMVKPSPGVNFWFIILVIMSFMDYESYWGFWSMTWILGLKSGTNTRVAGTGLGRKLPRRMHTHVVHVSGGFETHPSPYQESVWGFSGLKSQWDPGSSEGNH